MAKFKVGDKVTDGSSVFKITAVNPDGWDDYKWKLVKGDGKDIHGKSIAEGGEIRWADLTMHKLANSTTSTNPVVQNALKACNAAYSNATNYNPFFVGDVVTYDNTPGKRFKVRKCGTDWCKINEIDGSGNYVKGKYGLDYDAFVVHVGQIHKVKNSANAEVAKNAEDDYKAIANETRKVLVHLKSADDITVANVLRSISSNPELASKARDMWKHISESRKIANLIIQYAE